MGRRALRVGLVVAVVWFLVGQPTAAADRRSVPAAIPPVAIAAALPAAPVVLNIPTTTTTSTTLAPPTTYPRNALPVSLTFDDGPNATFTPQVLAVLARFRVKATFFVVGQQVEQLPDVLRRIVSDGHKLGNHTWDHADLMTLDDQQVAAEIDKTQSALAAVDAPPIRCFRAPYGHVTPSATEAIHARGLALSRWTKDSNDWKRPGTQVIVERALAGAEPGAVLLFHDSGPDMSQTVAALPAIIRGIQSRGLRIAPIC